MPKSDFNKVALATLLKSHFGMLLSCKFAVYFQSTFYLEHLGMAASEK